MHNEAFAIAQTAFRQCPTTETAWSYLVTAVNCGAGSTISDRTFFYAVGEVVDYLAAGDRCESAVESSEEQGPSNLH
jgi:hypothetical protein